MSWLKMCLGICNKENNKDNDVEEVTKKDVAPLYHEKPLAIHVKKVLVTYKPITTPMIEFNPGLNTANL